jgi:hypothetical protein
MKFTWIIAACAATTLALLIYSLIPWGGWPLGAFAWALVYLVTEAVLTNGSRRGRERARRGGSRRRPARAGPPSRSARCGPVPTVAQDFEDAGPR